MRILGIEKTSLIDYPHKICTVLFTGGCNFNCSFCHNSDLVYNNGQEIDTEEIINSIIIRKKFIDAICITGGEPTLQNDLISFIKEIKKIGLMVKLDTNGTNPVVIKELLLNHLVDFIAMDIKAPLNKYTKTINTQVDIVQIRKSIELIINSKIDYEFRTTVCRELLSQTDIIEIAKMINKSKRYIIQNFRDGETVLIGKGKLTPYLPTELEEIKAQAEKYVKIVYVR